MFVSQELKTGLHVRVRVRVAREAKAWQVEHDMGIVHMTGWGSGE